MSDKYLAISYKCLNAIGNTFDLESMLYQVVIEFKAATMAKYIGYYIKPDQTYIYVGEEIYHKEIAMPTHSYMKREHNRVDIVIFLRDSYLLCVYDYRDDLDMIFEILQQFERKLAFSISACRAIENLDNLNKELDRQVKASVEKIRKSEELLLVQSKNATMGEMVEMIAHQWRQPLTLIMMMIDNAIIQSTISKEGSVNISEFKDELIDIKKQIIYLSSTITDFHNFIYSTKIKSNIGIYDLFVKTISLVKSQLDSKGISININDKTDNKILYIYGSEFTQAILNIINNSIEAFEKNRVDRKYINITLEIIDDKLSVGIEDNAGGISEDIIDEIFNPYFTTKKIKNGAGLGLYITKILIMKQFDGTISVASRGNSTTFEMVVSKESINE